MASGGTELPSSPSGEKGQSSLPYSVKARRERSRELAQKRRTTYKTIMDDLTLALPFPKDVVSQLDYNSRLRLSLCFFRLKSLMESERSSDETSREDLPTKNTDFSLVGSHAKSASGMLQDLMNEALDGFLMVAMTDGTITYLSESIHKHLGLFQSEHIGISLYELILEDDHESVKKAIAAAEVTALARLSHNGGAELGFFCRMKCSRFKIANTITKSPGYKLVYISGSLKTSGSETFLVVVARPVSPPSILEIKMEGNMFVTHYSMEMKCTFFDGRLFSLMGYQKDDLLGDVVFTLHHHDDTEATMECSRGIMARGEGLSGYFRFLTRHGYYLWLQTRATLMHDSRTGKPSYIVCMNFVIDKEKGDKDLMQKAIADAKKEDDPVIQEINARSHDPFPLVSREDGQMVNPLDSSETSPSDALSEVTIKQESPSTTEKDLPTESVSGTFGKPDSNSSIPMSGEVSSSCSDSTIPDLISSKVMPGPHPLEEVFLPDSTSADIAHEPIMKIYRTDTNLSSRGSDTGYSSVSSGSLSKGGGSMFSPECRSSDVSSVSSNSPRSDLILIDRRTSPENPSSVFSGSTGSVSVASMENLHSQNWNSTNGASGVHQLEGSPSNSAPNLTSMLMTEQPLSHNSTPPQGFNSQKPPQFSNDPTPLNGSLTTSTYPQDHTHLLGKRQAGQNPQLKNEYTLDQQQLQSNYQQSNTAFLTGNTQPFSQQTSNVQAFNTSYRDQLQHPLQSFSNPPQAISNSLQAFSNPSEAFSNPLQVISNPSQTASHPQSLPDWQETVFVKREGGGYTDHTNSFQTHSQPLQSRQNHLHHIPPSHIQQVQHQSFPNQSIPTTHSNFSSQSFAVGNSTQLPGIHQQGRSIPLNNHAHQPARDARHQVPGQTLNYTNTHSVSRSVHAPVNSGHQMQNISRGQQNTSCGQMYTVNHVNSQPTNRIDLTVPPHQDLHPFNEKLSTTNGCVRGAQNVSAGSGQSCFPPEQMDVSLPVLTGEDLNVLDYIDQVGNNTSADIRHMPLYSQFAPKHQ